MSSRPRILWLHTQPEHYFNCMIDDLARFGTCEYIAAFARKAKSWATEVPVPEVAKTIILRRLLKAAERDPTYFRRFHANWRVELYPLKFDAAFVAGYAWRTNRELIHDCRRRGIPVAMFTDSNLRSQRGDSFKSKAKRWLKRKVLKSLIADLDYILVTNRLGIAYWRYYGAPSSKIILCPYYADYHRVDLARKTSRAEILGRVPGMKGSADPRYLFTAARLVPAKGLDLLIDAFKNARLAERNYHCVIAGIGPLEQELKDRAGDLLGKHIHFVGFQQPADNLALMAHADVFVLPSIYEPHGIVVQEALAAGTPVLASDVCGAAYDLVIPGISGDQFKSGDSKALQAKLEKLLCDPQRLSAMRSTARATFEKWFAETSPIAIVDQLAQRMIRKAPGTMKSS
jgi:glycosyltransferase involved in cell wall biosynthesis